MRAYILTVGDEILIGQVADTNAAFMAAALNEAGVEIVEHLSVADGRQPIHAGVERALAAADLVLMTGGLGPTKDDVTKQVLAEYFGFELVFHEPTWERLQNIIRGFGREPTPAHRQQCYLPQNAEVLTNERGTAPGMLFRQGGKTLVSLPGVPYEMRHLVRQAVLPRLRAELDGAGEKTRSLTIRTAGAGESIVAQRIVDIEDELPDHLSLAYLPNLGTVRLRLTARGTDEEALAAELAHYRARIVARISELVYGYGHRNLAQVLGDTLIEKKLRLLTTESCTGGAVAQMITANPGASRWFLGGVVAYDNALKIELLGVPQKTLITHGAVSEATVRAMVAGGLKRYDADLVLATSGVAGPGGGTPEKPVGTIWIAVGNRTEIKTELLRAGKDRKRNITFTTHRVLDLLRRFLAGIN